MRLSADDKALIYVTVLRNPFIPVQPFDRQVEFLTAREREVFYGGAAGGGKSVALMVAALQYVQVPHYSALILRRTYPELDQEGGLISIGHEWLQGTGADWNEQKKRWTFPSGATLQFGHMEHEKDRYRYQGSSFHFIGFDELTQFTEAQYRFMFRSLRKRDDDWIPLRVRSTGNPGGPGHEWVKARFIDGNRRFIPATWRENPFLDRDDYETALDNLDVITRQYLKEGRWDVRIDGGLFKRTWFSVHEEAPEMVRKVRYWDMAATQPSQENPDPDWTVGALLGVDGDGEVWVLDVRRIRGSPHEVESLVRMTAEMDGIGVSILMEQEGGASGKTVIDHYVRVLAGYDFRGDRPGSSKIERAKPLSSYAEAGKVHVLNREWLPGLLDELEAFPRQGFHDDQVDALSGAFQALMGAETSVGVAIIR